MTEKIITNSNVDLVNDENIKQGGCFQPTKQITTKYYKTCSNCRYVDPMINYVERARLHAELEYYEWEIEYLNSLLLKSENTVALLLKSENTESQLK